MAMKKIRLPVTIGVVDTEKSTPEKMNDKGQQVQVASVVTKMVPAGQLVELDEAEANRLLALHGPYTETVVVTDVPQGTPAPKAIPTATVQAPQRVRD